MVLKVTKSIGFTMFLVRVGLLQNPLNLITFLKTMIMKVINKINEILNRIKIKNFIKSIVSGVAFVEKMV